MGLVSQVGVEVGRVEEPLFVHIGEVPGEGGVKILLEHFLLLLEEVGELLGSIRVHIRLLRVLKP